MQHDGERWRCVVAGRFAVIAGRCSQADAAPEFIRPARPVPGVLRCTPRISFRPRMHGPHGPHAGNATMAQTIPSAGLLAKTSPFQGEDFVFQYLHVNCSKQIINTKDYGTFMD